MKGPRNPIPPNTKFGRLTVLHVTDKISHETYMYLCKCSCEEGNEILVRGDMLKAGRVKSCGCLKKRRQINIGGKFSNLEVVEFIGLKQVTKDSKKTELYKCKCICGNYIDVARSDLGERVRSCGCLDRNKDIRRPHKPIPAGTEFGRLTVLNVADKTSNGRYLYLCKCNCEEGNEVLVRSDNLKSGDTKSCGCLYRETFYLHGERLLREGHFANTSIYLIKSKRINKNNTSGVRGVTFLKKEQKWRAAIGFKNKNYYLGRYEKLEDAAKARKEAEERIYGGFLEWYYEQFPEKRT